MHHQVNVHHKARNHKGWTEAEVKILLGYHNAGFSAAAAAEFMGIDVDRVNMKAFLNGISLKDS